MSPLDPPKLHLNEHISPSLAEQLRNHGFDVISSQEADLLSASDDEQLEFAASEQRAVVTFNIGDFTALHHQYESAGREHWGIIFSPRQPIPVLFQRLLKLLQSVPAEQLKNQIYWLD
jgi:Domain of unknown function (DUF5615)